MSKLHLSRYGRLGAILILVALFLDVGFVQAAQANGAGSSSLVGTWNMESESPNGESISWTLTISQKNGNWTGTVGGPEERPAPASDFKVSGDQVHFRTLYQGDSYKIDLTLTGGKLTGTWTGDSGTGKTSGKRSS